MGIILVINVLWDIQSSAWLKHDLLDRITVYDNFITHYYGFRHSLLYTKSFLHPNWAYSIIDTSEWVEEGSCEGLDGRFRG